MRNAFAVLVLVILCSVGTALAGPAEDDEKKFLAAATQYSKDNPAAADAEGRAPARRNAKPAGKKLYPVPQIAEGSYKRGAIGVIRDLDAVEVNQVIDATTAVATPIILGDPLTVLPPGYVGDAADLGRALQEAMLKPRPKTRGTPFVWAIPTAKLVVGQHYAVGIVEVMGTQTYTTPQGAQQTATVLRQLDWTNIRKHLIETVGGPPVRTWTYKDKKRTIEGIFAGAAPGTVTILRVDGTNVVVDRADLSEDDRKYTILAAKQQRR
jgi:hypothetical protein